MRHTTLRDLDVPRLGLGTMGMSALYTGAGTDEGESVRTIRRAIELGVTFIDTAEAYGPYSNEELVGRAIASHRHEIVLATKFGLISHTRGGANDLDSSPANIRAAIDGSLARLGTDYVDVYYQHRVDPGVPIEDTMGALGELVAAGKVRYAGLSEASAATVRRANATYPVTVVQSEYSLWTRDPEAEVLPTLRELGIGFVAYSPLGRGFLTGQLRSTDALDASDFRRANPRFAPGNLEQNLRIVDAVEGVAAEVAATPAQVALAWLLAQGEGIVPIPGTRHTARLEENVAADAIELSAEQLARLTGIAPPVGDRYPDMTRVNR